MLSSVYFWFGVSGVVLLACVAVGYFVPGLRLLALEVAGGVLAAASIYGKGVSDEKQRWNNANTKAVNKGNQARADAERDVNAGRVPDRWDRDRGM